MWRHNPTTTSIADRGTNVGHRDNVGLRTAMQQQIPLIYFLGVVPGRYMASWPAYIVGDDYLPAPQARRLIGWRPWVQEFLREALVTTNRAC